MNTLTKENSKGKGLRIFAGIIFITYVMSLIYYDILCSITYDFYSFWSYSFLDNCANVIYYIAPLVIAVFLFIKKRSIPVTIALGAMLTAELYWFAKNLLHLGQDIFDNILSTLSTFQMLSAPLLPLCAFIFSLIILINERNRFVKLWFIPLIFAIFDIALRFATFFFSKIVYGYTLLIPDLISLLITISYNISFLFYCISLSRGATYKLPSANQQTQRPTPIQSYQAPVYVSPVYPETGQSYPISDTEELRKYKTMLDEGLISPDDYEKKKNEILNL